MFWLVRFLMFFFGIALAQDGFAFLRDAKSAFHQILAYCAFTAAAVCFVGCFLHIVACEILDALRDLSKQIAANPEALEAEGETKDTVAEEAVSKVEERSGAEEEIVEIGDAPPPVEPQKESPDFSQYRDPKSGKWIKCPKCEYVRTKLDNLNVPDFECPKWGVVYDRYVEKTLKESASVA